MKIAQINAVYGFASTGRITMELHKALLALGHSSFVIYGQGKNTSFDGYYMGCNLDHKIHAFLSRATGLVGYFSSFSTAKMLRYLDEIKPDIVHLHNLHSNYINIPMLLNYLGKNNIPTVITLHDCFFFTGKCTHYTVTDCYKWKSECGNCPRKSNDNNSWLFDRTKKMQKDKEKYFSKIDNLAILGVSKWVTKEAEKSSIFKNAKVFKSIYNWIDLEKFKPVESDAKKRLGLENKKIILGVASIWAESKGLNNFKELSKKIDEDVRIVLVGAMTNAQSLPSNIISIPATNNLEELIEYYSMADVFLNLSLEETFGKVTAEALACGTPAVVLNSTANPELIGEKCGNVLNSNDVDEILKAVKEIFKNGKDYYSSSCRDFVLKNFNKDTCIDDTIKLYKELLTKKD
ncbi:MAG: glycosyltransferase [Oscillospiraceae bacterium]